MINRSFNRQEGKYQWIDCPSQPTPFLDSTPIQSHSVCIRSIPIHWKRHLRHTNPCTPKLPISKLIKKNFFVAQKYIFDLLSRYPFRSVPYSKHFLSFALPTLYLTLFLTVRLFARICRGEGGKSWVSRGFDWSYEDQEVLLLPWRLCAGEYGDIELRCLRATSAASSRAFLMFAPSHQ